MKRLVDRFSILKSLVVLLLALVSSAAHAHSGLHHHNNDTPILDYAERDEVTISPSIARPVIAAQIQAIKAAAQTSQHLKYKKDNWQIGEVIVTSKSGSTAKCDACCPYALCQDCCPCGSGSITHCSIGHSVLIPAELNVGYSGSRGTVLRSFDRILDGLRKPPELKPPRS